MTLVVTTVPASPTAGVEVVFRVELTDPDGVSFNASMVEFGDGIGIGGGTSLEQCLKHGPWDPPAPDAAPAVKLVEFRHVFAAPGTYTARFSFDPGPFDCTDVVTGVGDRPYASPGTGEVLVIVAP